MGIAGKAVVEDGHVRTVRDLSSLNIRVAHEVKGCAKNVLPYLMDGETFLDTLLISPPGAGKTTLLRDLIRELSCGGTWGAGKNVSVVDERSEIAACFGGIAQCDLGPRTDVMDGCPKSEGMLMMLRSMAPQVLAVDEAGGEGEILAMKYGMNCGCRILATVHGADVGDIMKRPAWRELAEAKVFSRYVVLSGVPGPGTIVGIYDVNFQRMDKSLSEGADPVLQRDAAGGAKGDRQPVFRREFRDGGGGRTLFSTGGKADGGRSWEAVCRDMEGRDGKIPGRPSFKKTGS